MSSVDVALWVAVLFLAIVAGKMSLPSPPSLNWRDFFALCVVTPIRGVLDRDGGVFEDWVARSEAVTGRSEKECIYDDPQDFGSDYDLAHSLGMGASWELLASEPAELCKRLVGRNPEVRWLCRGGAMAESLREWVEVVSLEVPKEELRGAVEDLLGDLSSRVVLVSEGEAAQEWSELLHGHEGLRDRTLAVVGIQAVLDSQWLEEHFDHESMDTEMERQTPYFQLSFSGDGDNKGWPEPPLPASERRAVLAADLGPMACSRSDASDWEWARSVVLTVSHFLAMKS